MSNFFVFCFPHSFSFTTGTCVRRSVMASHVESLGIMFVRFCWGRLQKISSTPIRRQDGVRVTGSSLWVSLFVSGSPLSCCVSYGVWPSLIPGAKFAVLRRRLSILSWSDSSCTEGRSSSPSSFLVIRGGETNTARTILKLELMTSVMKVPLIQVFVDAYGKYMR